MNTLTRLMSKSLSRKSGVSGISGISIGSLYEEDPPSFLPLRRVGGHKFRISKEPLAYGSSGMLYRAKTRGSLTRRGNDASRMVIKILGVDDGNGELKKKESRESDTDTDTTSRDIDGKDKEGNGRSGKNVVEENGELESFTKGQIRSKTVEDFLEELTSLEDIETEIEIMAELQGSPFIVGLRDAFILERDRTFSLCFVVLESLKYSLVDLFAGLETHGQLDRVVLETIFHSVLLGLSFIHRNDVVHGDIKLDTILLSANGSIKISDFGLAKHLGDGRIKKQGPTVGTAEYMAPEMLSVEEEVPWYDEEVDIWALGVVLFCLVQGRFPFKEHFEAMHWMYYKRSNDLYFGKLAVELVADPVLFDRMCRPNEQETNRGGKDDGDPRSRSLRYKSIYNIIRQCMVPLPKEGIKDTPLEITRKDALDRATAEDLLESDEFIAADKRSDMTLRNVMKQAIQNHIVGKPVSDEKPQKKLVV